MNMGQEKEVLEMLAEWPKLKARVLELEEVSIGTKKKAEADQRAADKQAKEDKKVAEKVEADRIIKEEQDAEDLAKREAEAEKRHEESQAADKKRLETAEETDKPEVDAESDLGAESASYENIGTQFEKANDGDMEETDEG